MLLLGFATWACERLLALPTAYIPSYRGSLIELSTAINDGTKVEIVSLTISRSNFRLLPMHYRIRAFMGCHGVRFESNN